MFLEKTKEERENFSTNRIAGGIFISIGLAFVVIYPFFGETKQIFSTSENTVLFIGSLLVIVSLGLMLIKYPERLARREDFYDSEENKLREQITKDVKALIDISDKTNTNIEDAITKIILDKYEKEIDNLKIICFKKPLNERSSYLWFLFDKICEYKFTVFFIGLLMFLRLLYNVS